MNDDNRDPAEELPGASAPEPSLVAREAAATQGSSSETPGAPDTTSTDRVDARAATLGGAEDAGVSGGEAATTEDLAGDPGADPLKRT